MVIDKSKIVTSDFKIPPGMIDLSIGQPGMSLLPPAAPEANKNKVNFLPGSNFSPQRDLKNYMRLSFAYCEESDLKEAVKRLTAVIQ